MITPIWIEGTTKFGRNYRVWTHNPNLYKIAFYEIEDKTPLHRITTTWDTDFFETPEQARAAGEKWIKVGWSYHNKEAQE